MGARIPVKISKAHAQFVGVIASRADLAFALGMAQPPDLFELRLDRLIDCLDYIESKMSILRAPLIITARDPQEGGANRLSFRRRHSLLSRFLPYARHVDLELRSAPRMRDLLHRAGQNTIGRILSFHDFRKTPTLAVLKKKARSAKSLDADIFKIAARTDTPAQLARLLELVAISDVDLPISAMGMGKLGGLSRIVLAELGSVLVYASLGRPTVKGQLSLDQLRFALSALIVSGGS